MAQTGSDGMSGTGIAVLSFAILIPAVAAAQSPITSQQPDGEPVLASHWLASGFVGANAGAENSDAASVDFGGSVGYLWHGIAGAEFQANFSPDFDLDPSRAIMLDGEQPWINSYMFNAVAAVPLGLDGRFQPYVSGGFGTLTLRSDAFAGTPDKIDSIAPDDTRGGGNIGFGVMGFMRNIGLRGDVRWFRGFSANEDATANIRDDGAEAMGRAILSDLRFWRANVGVAFRF
jgi:hypothetical protein